MMKGATARRLFALTLRLGTALLAALPVVTVCPAQQSAPLLQITSPADGTVVNPGQATSVSVASPTRAAFTSVAVIGEDPIGSSNVAKSAPAQFSMSIPAKLACRTYALTAVGTTTSGQDVESDPILIDVERPDIPTSISPLMPSINFSVLGEQSPVILVATFPDGSILEVTRSSNVIYSSSNTSVATADTNGIVTALATGRAVVTATYTQSGQNVQATIPVTVPRQIMTVSPVSLNFGSQNVGTNSSSQQLTVTNAANGTLNIISVGTAGDFSETDNCVSSSPLPSGGTCTINVAFTPTGAGPRTGTLNIANGFSIIPSAISMTGTGRVGPTLPRGT